MINFQSIKNNYQKYLTSLEETSKPDHEDNHSENSEPIIQSKLKVYDFDCIMKEYSKNAPHIKKGFTSSSPDALYQDEKYTYLIEFKSGSVDDTDIYKKLLAGYLLF